MPNKTFSEILTFSRGSEGWYWGSDGFLKVAGVDDPRLTHDPATGEPQGLLVEEERTNSLLDNRDLSTGNWTKSAGLTLAKNAIGVDGAANSAHTATDTSTSNPDRFYQDLVIPDDNNTHSFFVFLLKDSDSSRYPELDITFSGGTEVSTQVQIDTTNGDIAYRANDGSAVVVDAGEWWQVVITMANNETGNTSLRFNVRPAITDNLDGSVNTSVTGSIVYDFGQVELNTSTASSPIETEGTAVTRAADVVTTDIAEAWKRDEATFILEYTSLDEWEDFAAPLGMGSSQVHFVFKDDNRSAPTVDFRGAGGSLADVVGSITIDRGKKYKITTSYDRDGRVIMTVNGVKTVDEVMSGLDFSGVSSTLQIASSREFENGEYSLVAALPYALTESEAQSLTQPEE